MANISRNTFDRLKHYVSVCMQQGVPLVDADWNEKDDIRKNEMQIFLKWFVGNGIPKDNDGFHIQPQAEVENDFLITGGANGQPGICLVEGWDARNETDIAYQAQPLFNNDALAQKWGVATLPTLTLPTSGQRTDLVYLDAWEREVNGIEDPGLVNPAINIETCVRLKREWVVRVAEGTSTLPTAVPIGHVFYPLATIIRRAGQPIIAQADIADLRKTGLAIMTDPVTIKNNNVGIGTTDPQNRIHVVGNSRFEGQMAVTGRITDQTGYVMPAGGIIMWSGAANNIPQGWALCDGSNGTPNLKDRFIVGAGSTYNPGNTGGQATVTLTANQMPIHTHTATQITHNHNNGNYKIIFQPSPDFGRVLTNWGYNYAVRQPDLIYGSNLQPATPAITVNNSAGGQSHDNIPPYYALCFIMKL